MRRRVQLFLTAGLLLITSLACVFPMPKPSPTATPPTFEAATPSVASTRSWASRVSGRVNVSVAVGVGMFVASLHPLVEPVRFAPAAFFGYATLFGLHAAGTGVLLGGVAGETVAAAVAMLVGAAIGYGTDRASDQLAASRRSPLEV